MGFRNFLEVTEDQLETIDRDATRFNNIFGNKLRIIIPLRKERSDYKLINSLAQAGYEINLATGMTKLNVTTFKCKKCNRQIQTNKKPNSCPSCKSTDLDAVPDSKKERTEKIGSVLVKLDKREQGNWKELLHWWEKNKDKKIEFDSKTGISIIISRSPIDIVRMSDHREFNSCHSPPNSRNITSWKEGTWFKSAIQEAKTGGLVAYAVHTSDLEKINDLQAPEIFKDRDRKIDGIEPLERVRLRRFSDEKMDIVIPELKSYGIKHIDFIETIQDWAKSVQKNVDFSIPPDFRDFDLYGGSYQDNTASELWNNFFGTHVTGKKRSTNEDEENHGQLTADRLQQLADDARTAHEANWKHVGAYAEANDEGEGIFLSHSGSVFFTFDKKQIIKEITYDDLLAQSRFGFRNYNTLGHDIREAIGNYVSIEDIQVNTHGKEMTLNCDVRSEGGNYYHNEENPDLQDFEGLLDTLDEIEKHYNTIYNKVYDALVERGFIKSPKEFKLQHFKWTKSEDSNELISEPMWIGDLQGVKTDEISRKIISFWQYNATYVEFTNKKIATNAKAIFPNLPQEAIYFMAEIQKSEAEIFTYPCKLYLQLEVEFMIADAKVMRQMQQIDEHWDYYYRRAVQWWNSIKPILLGQKKRLPGKMPVKHPKIKDQQLKLPGFKEWAEKRQLFEFTSSDFNDIMKRAEEAFQQERFDVAWNLARSVQPENEEENSYKTHFLAALSNRQEEFLKDLKKKKG